MTQARDKRLIQLISRKIKILRDAKGLTLEEAYFDTGIHFARIEQGKTNVSITTLSAVCKYLGISLREFFEDIE